MQKPVIAVLGRRITGERILEAAPHACCQRVAETGGVPVVLPETEDPENVKTILSFCDGLLVPGGPDVDPRFYGQEPLPELGMVDIRGDRCWMAAVRYARETGMPVLGICRGIQLANVALGGTLYQDIGRCIPQPLLHMQKHPQSESIHKVQLAAGSRLSRLLNTEEIYVNSTHHQSVDAPAPGLIVTAKAPDGVIEGLESADGQFILVQWHPEAQCQSDVRMLRLFEDLVRRAADWSAIRRG